MALSYQEAGVNKEAGYSLVHNIKDMLSTRKNPRVLNAVGSFGAFYDIAGFKNPVLVSGTDGVGTKLRIAFDMNKLDTIGIDCVAMCVNDILCHGAKPLFFLDYLACGKLDVAQATDIVKGIITGCDLAQASLIGGETAEMPGFYKEGEYDIAGFAVGAVEKQAIIDGSKIKKDDVLIALPSTGFHSNGFSLLRKLLASYDLKQKHFQDNPYETLGEWLLTPTQIYVSTILEILKTIPIHGIAHITGGGLPENVPRILSQGLCANIQQKTIFDNIEKNVPIFNILKSFNLPHSELLGTFNMGIGLVISVADDDAIQTLELLKPHHAFVVGSVIENNQPIIFS